MAFQTKTRWLRSGKKETAAASVYQGQGKLSIPPGSDMNRQLHIINLNEADLTVVKSLKPLIEKNIEWITEQFYGNITKQPNLLAIIEQHSHVERLKMTLKTHIVELFNGTIDDAFLAKRKRIAHAHVRIGLETKWYMSAFQDLLNSLAKIAQDHIENREDLTQAVLIISKLINFEQQIVLEAYEEENKRIRLEDQAVKDTFIERVSETSEELSAISEETSASIKQTTIQSENILCLAQQGSELADKSESFSASGKLQVEQQSENMTFIKQSMDTILQDSKELQVISRQINEVIDIVQDIAVKTNLLALNAAIEASRAGEHGRGFSVVADEIRALSTQTKHSTSTVSDLIAKTNSQVKNVSASVDKVNVLVQEGTEGMVETDRYFAEILAAMKESKGQNEKIEMELGTFAAVMKEIEHAMGEVAGSAEGLSRIREEFEQKQR
ncbi:heme-based aerotactic transducer [Sinobaca qinghaiensis]|uniref:Heme-based aerotactic transducer n=1 Tax=Sinobaca qinghaiensis TaxID=342944 RepID=A0A419V5P7_9BACL|nr:globin-coupled sensor protein [Sinobaca qinghaiensis]RKD75161.1 heme-based aerotactic transducer [Sinobaca qinghaiensis]